MNLRNELEECCVMLESTRVNDRKKSCDRLSNLLDNEDVILLLNSGKSLRWRTVISSIQECIRKDADKIADDTRKKGSSNLVKYPSADLFYHIIKSATKEVDDEVDISNLVGYIIGCLKDSKMKLCYESTFLIVMKDIILSNPRCRGRLDSDDWLGVFNCFKKLCEENGKSVQAFSLKCFMLIIKYGPCSGLPSNVLREHFEYITKMCQMISRSSPMNQQEDILEIALDFCMHTAKDNRVSCCKLGEDVFSNLVDLYELNGSEAKIKRQLIEFYLLQVFIHQPDGVIEGHPCAYAVNWSTWKKCLKMIYSLLHKEIDYYFIYPRKNASFFIRKGESVILWDNFSKLFVDVSQQMFLMKNLDVTMSLNCTLTSQGPQKRPKLEVSLKSFINNVQETKSWLWIHIVSSVIKAYPNSLEAEDYLNLLQILSALQIESNDHNVIDNIYACLIVMLDIENKIELNDYRIEIEKVWKSIGESTLRALGLNQHKQATESLLQKLIPKRLVDLNSIIQSYCSCVLSITDVSIDTIYSSLQNQTFMNTATKLKESVINCILNNQNIKDHNYLLYRKTAKLLVNLTLQQWPLNDSEDSESIQESDELSDIKEIYHLSVLEKTIEIPKAENKKNKEVVAKIDSDGSQTLKNIVQQFVYSINNENLEHLLSTIVLLLNITSYMVEYKILEEKDVNEYVAVKLIEYIFGRDTIKDFSLYQNKTDREARKLLECIRVLDRIFTFNDGTFLVTKIRNLVPLNLLKTLANILNDLQEGQKNTSLLKFELKRDITKVLSNFCCISNTSLNLYQKQILEMISYPNYDYNSDDDYTLLLTFLNTFKYSKPGIISESTFENVLNSIKGVCIARYRYSENAVEILNTIYVIYPHLVATCNFEIKSMWVELLNPFYEKRNDFGPNVSLALLNCIGRLCELDPEFNIYRWEDMAIIRYVPEFLCSDYQEIRFKAIKVLVIFFQVMSRSKSLEDVHRQEEIICKMFEKSLEVFDVTGEITQERRIDEIVSRTASVLHTFASIILCCNSWIEECLFMLVKLAYKKNIGSVDKILDIINTHYGQKTGTSCVEKYLEFILEKWLGEGYNIDIFPFKLFQCDTKSEFYLKYFDICVPLLIVTERKDIIATAQQLNLNEKDIVKNTCSKIFGRALCQDVENSDDLINKNKILSYYAHVVGLDVLKQYLVATIDQLLLCILSFLTDEKYIHKLFSENVIFSTKHLSLQKLETCINYVESLLCGGEDIITFLSINDISKLEKIMLQLKLTVYNVYTLDDKLKSFHRYGAMMNIILNHLEKNSVKFFVIKDTTYTLINLIVNHSDNPQFISGVCSYLTLFLKKILPTHCESFENLLTFTVNSLKNFILQKMIIAGDCLEILRFLIVQNSCHLMTSIEKLDNFPQLPEFDSIRNVHKKIKYGNEEASLKEEINFFLQHKDLTNRQDSLIHLRNILSKEKVQLKEMYDKLEETRGFSEDCEKSALHKLICVLAKMSCSENENVRLEAMKCLGEIGPADLTTLVLQHETTMSDVKCTPFELLTANLLSLLGEYVVDSNMELVKCASEALYVVLDSKEGKKIAETNVNIGCELVDRKYFEPFFPRNKSSPGSNATVFIEKFADKIDDDELWTTQNTSHEKWIVLLVTSLLQTFTEKSYLPQLVPLCNIAPKLCERLLPLLVNLLLHINHRIINNVLSTNINLFFASHWNCTVPKYTQSTSITVNKRSVKCMLNVVSFVRLQKDALKSGRQVAELDLNYLKAAKAAEFCAAHFTALLYSELWCQSRIQEIEEEGEDIRDRVGLTKLNVIYKREDEQVGEALQDILRNAYKAIGDLDALSGCGNMFLLKPQFWVEHYKELNNWNFVVHFYEMQVSQGVSSARKGLMDSLKKCNLYELPLFCTKQSEEPQYECLWRLGRWDVEDKQIATMNTLTPTDYEKYRFYSLKALHDCNEIAFSMEKKSQSLCMVEHLKHTSLESSQNMYPVLAQLQAIKEMEDFAEAIASTNFPTVLTKWKLQDDLIKKNNFQFVEPIFAQRIVMLTDFLRSHTDDDLKNYFVNTLLDFTDLARKEEQLSVANRALESLRCIADLSEEVQTRIQLAMAQLSWSGNDKMLTRHILNKLCQNENIDAKLRAQSLKLLGQYMSETFSENRLVIISEYFLKSLVVIKSTTRTQIEIESILDTYDRVAQFADKGYQQIMAYMKSDSFQRKIVNMEKARKTGSNIQRQNKRTLDECRAVAIHVKQSNIDEAEINTTKSERDQFLKIALKYYLKNLKSTDEKNIRVFRVMALFLENRNNPIIADTIKEILPSYKYITILPQLIPHITENNPDLYNKKVYEIVEKCAIEHPHHTLPLLLSLANSNEDRKFSDSSTITSSNDDRVKTAKNLLGKLKKRAELTSLIDRLQLLSLAFIELAYYKETDTGSHRKREFNIPRTQKITKIKNFDDVLLPTCNLPVNKQRNYSNIVGIQSFGPVYHPVGGINAPKRITCRGTDGKQRSQLLKGHDDLRQDAVMQQVFTILNNLLAANKQTKNLLIRTYKIVPLSMRSGILEWVDNSMPIGDYLVGGDNQPGAHQSYRPKDKSPSWCREMIKKPAEKTADKKLEVYMNVCKHFKPVFHKFFETYFLHPTVWYERKRAYIYSVATTSMCGYILGIGDRHVSNIMIDKTTAEVIHIDFGIAFEQGRVLPTPETVPFRLTRDIVDGMGVSGIEGLFRRSCEKTMEVLRQNSQTIITILEVLLYDPLYVWTVTAAEANKRQTDDDVDLGSTSADPEEDNVTVNITAERALLRLREKLQGTELGNPTSIEHQVGTLIQQAMDPANLCKLFHGWQAYL